MGLSNSLVDLIVASMPACKTFMFICEYIYIDSVSQERCYRNYNCRQLCGPTYFPCIYRGAGDQYRSIFVLSTAICAHQRCISKQGKHASRRHSQMRWARLFRFRTASNLNFEIVAENLNNSASSRSVLQRR